MKAKTTKQAKKKIAGKKQLKSLKKTAKKTIPKKAAIKKIVVKEKKLKPIGVVTHFFNNIDVAIVKFKKPVKVGTTIRFKGATTDFEEKIKSMQYNHVAIAVAKKGQDVGIKIEDKVREGDIVYEV